MKVLHMIGGGDIGGARIHVISLVKELSKYIDVKIISFRHGIFSDEAKALGLDVEIIKTGLFWYDLYKLVHIIKNEGFDLVHAHGAKANMMACFCKKIIHIPIVTTIHSDYKLDYLQSFMKDITFGKINALALRMIDYHIGVSTNFQKMLVKRGFDKNQIYKVYNGIDFNVKLNNYNKTEYYSKFNIPFDQDTIFVGILARLHPVKDIDTFLLAAKEILYLKKNVNFLIGGDGEEMKRLRKKTAQLGISDNVFYLGFITDPYEFMNSIDINVLTSLSESFPYTILEGTIFKKATISTDVGGISDLITHKKNGFLFEPEDYKSLTKYLLKLIEDTNLRITFGEQIYNKAKSTFSLKNMCKSQLDIYSSVILKYTNPSIKKNCKVLISGYHGSNNIGDDAILSAIIKDLNGYIPNVDITVLSRNFEKTIDNYNVNSISWLMLPKILLSMLKSDLFITGGGSLIQNIKSTRSLFYYLSLIWFAKKFGITCMLYANGIGPLKGKFAKYITSKILNKVDVITLRDHASSLELEKLGVTRPKVIITADPALSLEPCSDNDLDLLFENEDLPTNKNLVGISVRNWNKDDYIIDEISKFINYLNILYGYIPVLIPMQYPEDLIFAEKITAKTCVENYVIRNSYNPNTIIGLIKKMDVIIGMRLHALIFAANTSTPFIGIEYEQKIRGFLNHMDINDITYAGHIDEINFEILKDKFEKILPNINDIKFELIRMQKIYRNKSLQNAKIASNLVQNKVKGDLQVVYVKKGRNFGNTHR